MVDPDFNRFIRFGIIFAVFLFFHFLCHLWCGAPPPPDHPGRCCPFCRGRLFLFGGALSLLRVYAALPVLLDLLLSPLRRETGSTHWLCMKFSKKLLTSFGGCDIIIFALNKAQFQPTREWWNW